MTSILRTSLMGAIALVSTSPAHGQAVGYTDEGAFLQALASEGVPVLQESFDDDTVWGGVRSTIVGGNHTAPAVANQGITWTANNANSQVTTSMGAALSGSWGFYSLPHGDSANGIRDGFVGTGDQPLIAVGGWIRSNTPPAKLGLLLDGVPTDFGGEDALSGPHRFFGAIHLAGFTSFEFVEQEAEPGDWKLIFSDDFRFAFGGTIVDCNSNGIADPLDIRAGASLDCDLDLVPDECQIAQGSADCNGNGILDTCETTVGMSWASGQLSPIGTGAPQSFVIPMPPPSLGSVVMDLTAHANLGGGSDHLDVDVNGVHVGSVFGADGSDCPEDTPDVTRLVVPMATFNAAVAGGDATIGLTASAEVDPDGCDAPTWVTVTVEIRVSSSADANGNGIPDECEGPGVARCFGDGTGTSCPCGNDSPVAAHGCLHSGGVGMTIAGSGTTSIATDDLTLFADDCPPGNSGIFYVGRTSLEPGTALFDGLQCAGGDVRRFQGHFQSTGSVSDTGFVAQDPSAVYFVAGATYDFQYWTRDVAVGTSPCATLANFSPAYAVTMTP